MQTYGDMLQEKQRISIKTMLKQMNWDHTDRRRIYDVLNVWTVLRYAVNVSKNVVMLHPGTTTKQYRISAKNKKHKVPFIELQTRLVIRVFKKSPAGILTKEELTQKLGIDNDNVKIQRKLRRRLYDVLNILIGSYVIEEVYTRPVTYIWKGTMYDCQKKGPVPYCQDESQAALVYRDPVPPPPMKMAL
jgi:hypothetical protein